MRSLHSGLIAVEQNAVLPLNVVEFLLIDGELFNMPLVTPTPSSVM